MEKNLEEAGYQYKYVIDLATSNNATLCFNDGNGNWDSRYGQNYYFEMGTYTYSNGNIHKIS